MCSEFPINIDLLHKLATITIACCSLYLTIHIYKNNTRKSDSEKQKDRNIQWLKVLILDHNLKYFYAFFEEIQSILIPLNQNKLTDVEKAKIDEDLTDAIIKLRMKFIDTLIAVDGDLYEIILKKFDDFQTSIVDVMFDNGINLTYGPKFNQEISSKLVELKTDILKKLFNYNG